MAGWEQTVKSVSLSASQLLYLTSSFVSPRKGCWLCPAMSLRGSAAWVAMPPASQCHTFAPATLHSAASTPSWVWRQPFHGMRMCRCHPEFTAATTAKNALNRDALESQHKTEALCWKYEKKPTICKFTLHLYLQVSSNILGSISCLVQKKKSSEMSGKENPKNILSCLELSVLWRRTNRSLKISQSRFYTLKYHVY